MNGNKTQLKSTLPMKVQALLNSVQEITEGDPKVAIITMAIAGASLAANFDISQEMYYEAIAAAAKDAWGDIKLKGITRQ